MTSYLVTKNGDLFMPTEESRFAKSCLEDYKFDIREDDIVIDIGANIGGFCIPAARLSKSVCAIEPLMSKELYANIALNMVNVRVIECGLGDGSPLEVYWEDIRKEVPTMTLGDIKKACGGCDFLKIDCEGGEWFIKPEEFEGIRRLEMELHQEKFTHKIRDMYKMLDQLGFSYTSSEHIVIYDSNSHKFAKVAIVHATNLSLEGEFNG